MNPNNIAALLSKIKHKSETLIIHELAARNLKGLAPSHADLLLALAERKKTTMKDLAEIIDRDKSTITTLINKLARMGLVKRIPDTQDKRVCYIALTARGAALCPALLKISEILLERLYQFITPIERETLTKLLIKINSYW